MLQQTTIYSSIHNIPQHASETNFVGERARLVRLCTRLTGNADAAEDLAQETLLEAWRNMHKFEQQDQEQTENWPKWLSAIARNVCKRWARAHYYDSTHVALFASTFVDEDEFSPEELIPGGENIEIDFEREELALLLDRALALLPPSVREVLIERYINESSHAEISERLNLSEDALVQRLHRGKLALRRVISTHLSAEAETFGIRVEQTNPSKSPTRIWCPMCGKGQLIKYYDVTDNRTSFICSQCWHIASVTCPDLWAGVKSPKSILDRQLSWLGNHYWQPINEQHATCIKCGHTVNYGVYLVEDAPASVLASENFIRHPGIYISCAHCGHQETNCLPHMTLDIPEARHFWRKHARMHWLPRHEIEFAGRTSLISSFQSLSDSAQLDIIIDQATFKILSIYEC